MNFKLLRDIKLTKYISENLKEEPIICKAILPGYQIRGYNRHVLSFYEPQNSYLILSEDNFQIFDKFLSNKNFNKELLDSLGEFFKLKLVEVSSTAHYAYNVETQYGHLLYVKFAYYYSEEKNLQYFILYSYYQGEERTNEEDTIYIDRIWQVEFIEITKIL